MTVFERTLKADKQAGGIDVFSRASHTFLAHVPTIYCLRSSERADILYNTSASSYLSVKSIRLTSRLEELDLV